MAHSPLILPFAETTPHIEGGLRHCGASVSLLGRLQMGREAWLGPKSVIRADGHFVRIGDDFRLGERGTIHIAHERFPAIIGDRVTAGRDAVLHACTIGDDCVIDDGAVVLDGSVVETGVHIEANSVVFPRSTLNAGWVYAGSPAVPVREIGAAELAELRQTRSAAILDSIKKNDALDGPQTRSPGGLFVARTASLQGDVKLDEGVGVFFACDLRGASAGITIGVDCNIQDNTVMDASEGAITIGDGVTFGHNVHASACSIGDGSLIGIGSTVAPGTIVEENVLLAAGAFTTPGQRLEQGWLWGGRPARAISPLNDAKRMLLSLTIVQYRAYAEQYARAQQDAAETVD